ncbi:ABC transporter substrate-binding protein [Nostoc sp.]|uniref:ABC transporter substrate-binding protein n=1 Tax=Nostoc sp. TaxID=1180 RepID=UPI002FF486C6
MSFESNVKLTIALSNPDLDAEEQERETRNLLREIRDLDVESAELVAVTEIPAGARSVGGFLVGVLQTEVSIANFKKLLGFLGDHLGNKTIEFEVEANGKKLKVKASSQKELAAAIEQAAVTISGLSPYVFRTVPSDAVAAQLLVKLMLKKSQKNNVAFFYNFSSEYGRSLTSQFQSFATQNIEKKIEFNLSKPNFDAGGCLWGVPSPQWLLDSSQ